MNRILIHRKIYSIVFFVIPLCIFSIGIFLEHPQTVGDYLGFGFIMLISLIMILIGIRMIEYANIDDSKIVIKSLFGSIKSIRWEDVVEAKLIDVAINASRGQIVEKCIVLYLDKKTPNIRTTHNGKKDNVVKLKHTKNNFNVLSKYISITL